MPSQVRSSYYRHIHTLCESLNLDSAALAEEVGLPARALLDPDQKVSSVAIAKMIELAAVRSGAHDFGLRLGASRSLNEWGLMGLAARSKSTLGEYLNVLATYATYQNNAVQCALVRLGEHVEFRILVGQLQTTQFQQNLEMSVATHIKCLREAAGEDAPVAYVTFRHDRIGHPAVYRQHLGVMPFFGAEYVAIGHTLGAMNHPLQPTRPLAGDTLDRLLQKQTPRRPAGYADAVAQNLRALIGVMDCSIDQMARMFGLTARTLQRKLSEEGLTYSQVIDQVRTQMAAEYIDGTDRPLAEVSDILGFKSQSALAHWHKSRHGESALDRRRRARLGRLAG